MKYEHKNHSKFLLMYHVIFVCKYRKKILGTINSELKQTIHDIEHESDFEILDKEITGNNEKIRPMEVFHPRSKLAGYSTEIRPVKVSKHKTS